jgi:coproporphyrinogen III oxidase-like Fe-S oxidoreductase
VLVSAVLWCCLKVEQGTPFERWYSGKDSPLPQEPEAVAMFEAASATLTAVGYEHYEVGRPWSCFQKGNCQFIPHEPCWLLAV